MAEEKYELVHRRVVETWGQINEEPEEGELTPEVIPEKYEKIRSKKKKCVYAKMRTMV